MSVIIHGMEMPNYCSECPMGDIGDICCITGIDLDFADRYERRSSLCPLEERKAEELEYITLEGGYPKFCPNCGANMNGGENDER